MPLPSSSTAGRVATESLPRPREYFPFEAGPFRHSIGLKPLDPAEWIEIDDQYPVQLRRKAELLESHRDAVFVALPAARQASVEVLDLLSAHLAVRFPAWFERRGSVLENRLLGQTLQIDEPDLHPLDLAARTVQEDLCLMQARGAEYVLTAGSVCFPSRWSLVEKLGRNMAEIHAPVPHFDEQIGPGTDRVMAKMQTDRWVWRINWSIHRAAELFQPLSTGQRPAAVHEACEPAALSLRVERQTLRRLPASGAILFTIRTLIRPLADIQGRPDVAARLAAALRQLPAAMIDYKGYQPLLPPTLAWLDRQAAASPG